MALVLEREPVQALTPELEPHKKTCCMYHTGACLRVFFCFLQEARELGCTSALARVIGPGRAYPRVHVRHRHGENQVATKDLTIIVERKASNRHAATLLALLHHPRLGHVE
jgi:hypothetical protein